MVNIFPDLMLRPAEKAPEKVAVLQNERSLTYAEIYHQSMCLGGALREWGICRGDRVCLYLERRLEKVITLFGISAVGGVFVPIRSLAKANQVIHIVNDSGARILITSSQRMTAILDHLHAMPCLEAVIVVGKGENLSASGQIKLLMWEDIIARRSSPSLNPGLCERDIAAILYTSGSTGMPKGVVLSHLNIVAGAKKVADYLKINSSDRLLSVLTFSFDYGLNQLTTAFLRQAQIVLLDYIFPQDVIRAVGKFNITGLAAVPTIWLQLLQQSWEGSAMENLRYITNTGGSIPPNYVMELRKRLPRTDIFLMYGLTEAFRSTFLDPSLVDRCPTSIGKAVPGEEIMVLNEYQEPVKPGEIGELVHRGVFVSQGYWGDLGQTNIRFRPNPLQSDKVLIPEMVVYSGDYVRVDEDGFLYFIGRRDEMIKCSGNRISPTEVEEIIYSCERIAEATVFGVPDEVYGQKVFAVVSPAREPQITVEELKIYCKSMMPLYMVPGGIEIWEKLPRLENGKLDRSGIKKEIYSRLAANLKS